MPQIGEPIDKGRWLDGPKIPAWLIGRTEVSQGAKVLYARLHRYGRSNGDWFASLETMAEDIGASRRSVQSWLGELTDHQLIASTRRGQGLTNKYAFLYHPWIEEWFPNQNGEPFRSGQENPASLSSPQVLKVLELKGRTRRVRQETPHAVESLPDPDDASMPVLGANPRPDPEASSRTGRPDSGAGLARHFARTARQNLTVEQMGPGPFNHSRLATAFVQWKREGFDSERIRIMIDIYLRPDHRRPPGKALWLGLLSQRAVLDKQAKKVYEASRPAEERYSADYAPKTGSWDGAR